MPVITTFQVVDCNRELERLGIVGRVRLHDACGRQTLGLEVADDTARAQAQAAVSSFFESARVPVEFSADGRTFWAC